MKLEFCTDAAPAFFGLLNLSAASPLLYYIYVISLVLPLGLAIITTRHQPLNQPFKQFHVVVLFFLVYATVNFLVWFSAPTTLAMFSAQLWPLALSLLAVSTFVLGFAVVRERPVPQKTLLGVLLPLVPIALLLPTSLNIAAFDQNACAGIPHGLLHYYSYLYTIALAGAMLYLGRHIDTTYIRHAGRVTIGGSLALLTIVGTSLLNNGATSSLYVAAGMLVFTAFLAMTSCVIAGHTKREMRSFALELLTVILVTLAATSLFTYARDHAATVAGLSLLAVILMSWFMFHVLRQAARERTELSQLTARLEQADARLRLLDKEKSEFITITSHQLRGPLTTIRGYASLLQEGSYGRISKKVSTPVARIEETSKSMVAAIEDYLNVSRIEAGSLRYTLTDFNLRDQVEYLCDAKRPEAIKQGLMLLFRSDLKSRGIVHADQNKTLQIIKNLIDNAIKYTQHGSIKVFVFDNVAKQRIYVDVVDTGIGMDEDTRHQLFQKFQRAKQATTVDTRGSGLSLYIALGMATAMGGTITTHSDGEGTGSRFTLELPLAM